MERDQRGVTRGATRRVWTWVRAGAAGTLAALVLICLVSAVLPVAIATSTKGLLDSLTANGGAVRWAVTLAVLTAIAAWVPSITSFWHSDLGRSASQHSIRELYGAIDQWEGLDALESVVIQRRIRLADTAARDAPGQLVQGLLGLTQGAITVVLLLLALWQISRPMCAVVAVSGLPALALEWHLARRRTDMAWRATGAERRHLLGANLMVDARVSQESKLFGSGPWLVRRLVRDLEVVHRLQRSRERRDVAAYASTALLSSAVLGAGVVQLVAGTGAQPTPGEVAFFLAAVVVAQNSLASLVGSFASVRMASLLLDHYGALLDMPAAGQRPAVTGGAATGLAKESAVSFSGVWFRYSPESPDALQGVDMHAPRGGLTVVTGRNGSGKSTIIKLALGLHHPQQGRVTVDGGVVGEGDMATWRRRLTAVFQETVRYDLTAADNIAIARPDLLEQGFTEHASDVQGAADEARIADDIKRLPNGYETVLSRAYSLNEDEPTPGTLLSGGQWQRVGLARSLVRRDASVIFLDEPTAHLDAEAEASVRRALHDRHAGITVVMVTHRLASARGADHVVVIDAGRTVDQGTHVELLGRCELYRALWEEQAAPYRDVERPSPPNRTN